MVPSPRLVRMTRLALSARQAVCPISNSSHSVPPAGARTNRLPSVLQAGTPALRAQQHQPLPQPAPSTCQHMCTLAVLQSEVWLHLHPAAMDHQAATKAPRAQCLAALSAQACQRRGSSGRHHHSNSPSSSSSNRPCHAHPCPVVVVPWGRPTVLAWCRLAQHHTARGSWARQLCSPGERR